MENTSIHFVMWRIGLGGVELALRPYGTYFGERRKVYAYSLRPGDSAFFEGTGIKSQHGTHQNWRLYVSYFRYCREYRNHIFHLKNAGPIILVLTRLAGVRKIVYSIHGTKYWKKGYDLLYKKPLWMLASLFRVTYLANSNYSASLFYQQVMSVFPRIIYNGFRTQHFTQVRRLRTSPRRIGYAGRFYKGKNVDLVIRLFEEVAGSYPDLELVLAGEGPLRAALEYQADKSRYKDRIRFAGFVKDMPRYFNSLDLLVFPSSHESFGNVLAEALLTGLPVLTSDLPVFQEIYGKEDAFVLGDPGSYQVVKNRFLQLLGQFDLLAQKAYALSDPISKNFSLETHFKEIEQVYETL